MKVPNTVAATLVLAAFLVMPNPAHARGHGGSTSRAHYSGSKHSESHGGHYSNGSGSSHKGGSYRNSRTGNRYGKHGR